MQSEVAVFMWVSLALALQAFAQPATNIGNLQLPKPAAWIETAAEAAEATEAPPSGYYGFGN
ncbi:MAG: hypothetical protein P4L98_02245 [Ancalomicrobiaceae bacterium]|nr:hypothetical protein [Ancalomicrobiaceae bacterium]